MSSSRLGYFGLIIQGFPLLLALVVTRSPGEIPQPSPKNSFPFPIEPGNAYVGYKVCATCHSSQAKDQAITNHARTWSTVESSRFGKETRLSAQEGPPPAAHYRVGGGEGGLGFQVQLPGGTKVTLPVHSIIGGERFGFSFVLEARQINGLDLAGPALVEGRYMFRTNLSRLSISPGLPAGKPTTFDTALGRVLSPSFAARCFDCHGGLINRDAGELLEHPVYKDVAVRCERCHGPGKLHVEAVGLKKSNFGILHPGKIEPRELLRLCAQCHGGFTPLKNPRPQDVLISAQVVALTNSYCYLESGGKLSCLQCHDGHRNATRQDPRYLMTCLSCHKAGSEVIALCPVNKREACIGCHMPVVRKTGNFELTDHWIRVVRRAP